IEKELDLDLRLLIQFSLDLHADIPVSETLVDDIYDFIVSRLKAYYAAKGVSAEQFEAVRVCAPAHPLDFGKRIDAVCQFSDMEGADSLSAANKRIANILKKYDGDLPEEVDTTLFEEAAEKDLFEALDALRETVSNQIAGRDYAAAMALLATIRQPVDAFFDQVMVMADSQAVKQNRLALLNQIYQLFLQVADISRL
ncbi:MAG: DALR anticodon-binding domain-containing protein, partial [Hydrogenovibrio sp.]